MIGILLVTHNPLGAAFLQVLAHIFGAIPPMIGAVDIATDESRESAQARILAAIASLDSGKGVLLITDIAGATPSNCSCDLKVNSSLACIAGANLPMLLRAIHYRHQPLKELTHTVLEGGRLSMLKL